MNPHLLSVLRRTTQRLKVTPYLVGGPVRDRLMGNPCRDWDFACQKAKATAQAISRKLRAKLVPLDEQNRIYRIVLPSSLTLDFAELQGEAIEQDLKRRDFTINAMACTIESERIIDPFNGRNDLKRKIIRAVSREAFQEDPLRILRAFRFSAQLGFRIERETLRWLSTQHRTSFEQVARERVREELMRLLSQVRAGPALYKMDRAGLLMTIFPEMEAGRRIALDYYGKGGVLKHALQSVDSLEWILAWLERERERVDDWKEEIIKKLRDYVHQPISGFPRYALLKLGALLHDVGKPATAQLVKGRLRFFGHEEAGAGLARKMIHKLRFSHQEVQLVSSWVRNHMRPGNLASLRRLSEKAVSRFFRNLGEEGVGMLLISLGDHYTYLVPSRWGKGTDPVEKTSFHMLRRYYLEGEKVIPPKIINGHVLMRQLHLKPGPVIGKLLAAIQDAQAEGKIHTLDQALQFAKTFKAP